jgi:hypothetical protein
MTRRVLSSLYNPVVRQSRLTGCRAAALKCRTQILFGGSPVPDALQRGHTPKSPLSFARALSSEGTFGRIARELSPLVCKLVGRERGAGACSFAVRLDRVLLVALLVFFSACASTKQYPAGSFTIDGVMHHTNLEGGCWVFRTSGGQSYELIGDAAKDLLHKGLRAEIVVRARRDVMSTCMVGKIVEVVEVKEIHFGPSPN